MRLLKKNQEGPEGKVLSKRVQVVRCAMLLTDKAAKNFFPKATGRFQRGRMYLIRCSIDIILPGQKDVRRLE